MKWLSTAHEFQYKTAATISKWKIGFGAQLIGSVKVDLKYGGGGGRAGGGVS